MKQKPGPPADGEGLFAQKCASCHGAKGEGGVVYPKALTGPLSVEKLAGYLEKSMPPGPKHVTATEAKKVAAFMHPAFYSPLAHERNRPARVALSRLTGRQYRNALADLIGSFRPSAPPESRAGLKGTYFKARRMSDSEKVLERIDPSIHFDFGTAIPAPGGFDPYQFSIRWSGGLLAPDSGEYEIVVRTNQSFRLWINDEESPLIDGFVKSGKGTEFSAPIHLLGGRRYPLRLEFSKSTAGVDDTKDQDKRPVAPAFVTLAWKRPHLAEEPIPARCLSPNRPPEVFSSRTPLPPDDRSMGYERGDSVSKAWDEATTNGAIETVSYLATRWKRLLPGADERTFAKKFVERALRHPLSPDEEQFFVARQFDKAPDAETALRRVMLLTLKSPGFLFREAGESNAFATASKLSFTLRDAPPDEALLRAAAEGKLSTREGVRAEAERLIKDPLAWAKLREFLLLYLKVDHVPDIAKDEKRFPDFDAATARDLRTSLELFLESTAWSEKADLRELLLSEKVFLNGNLARLYGADLAPDAPFQAVSLPERAGVLTQPYVLSAFAYLAESSPIHRGVLLSRSFLGRTLAPPPVAVAPVAASLAPGLTTRQRVSRQTKPTACASCHDLINPLGFTLEKFDAIGRLRDKENGQKIDDSGSYRGKSLNGAKELAKYLSESPEVHQAFVEKLFQNFTHQPIRAWGPQTLPTLTQKFKDSGYNIRDLMVQTTIEASVRKP
jgi:cytochrome c553